MRKRARDESCFCCMKLADFSTVPFTLLGDHKKFATPRYAGTLDVPLLQLPSCTLHSVEDYNEKQFLVVHFDQYLEAEFDALHEWLAKISDKGDGSDRRVVHKVCRLDSSGNAVARIRLLSPCYLFSASGSFVHECSTLPPVPGSRMRLLVELSCVWFTETTCGLTLQAIQIQLQPPVSHSTNALMIEDEEEEHPEQLTGLQIVDSSYEPFSLQ